MGKSPAFAALYCIKLSFISEQSNLPSEGDKLISEGMKNFNFSLYNICYKYLVCFCLEDKDQLLEEQPDNSEQSVESSSTHSSANSSSGSSSGSCSSSRGSDNLLNDLETVISRTLSESAERYTNRPPSILENYETAAAKDPLATDIYAGSDTEVYVRTLDTKNIIHHEKTNVPEVRIEADVGAVPAARLISLLLLGLVEFLCGNALSILAPFYTTEAASKGLSGQLCVFTNHCFINLKYEN